MIHKNWQELIKPQQLVVKAGADAQRIATVTAEPLERGFGLTLGNALRRVLMSGTLDGVRIDTTLSLLIPYAAFLAGDKLGVSGVLAVVAAGLCGGVLDHRHLRASTRLNGVALGLVLGGGMGNLWDRMVRGEVIDFLHFKLWGPWSFPDFNLADVFIVSGVGLLMIELLVSEGLARAEAIAPRTSGDR